MSDNTEIKLTENEKEAFSKGEDDYEKAVICQECGGLGEAAEKGGEYNFCFHYNPPTNYEELYHAGWKSARKKRRFRLSKILDSLESKSIEK